MVIAVALSLIVLVFKFMARGQQLFSHKCLVVPGLKHQYTSAEALVVDKPVAQWVSRLVQLERFDKNDTGLSLIVEINTKADLKIADETAYGETVIMVLL